MLQGAYALSWNAQLRGFRAYFITRVLARARALASQVNIRVHTRGMTLLCEGRLDGLTEIAPVYVRACIWPIRCVTRSKVFSVLTNPREIIQIFMII